MVGVVKQEKSNGTLQQIDTIQFGNTQLTLPEPEYEIYEEYDMASMPMATTSNANFGPSAPVPMPMYDMMKEAEEERESYKDSDHSSRSSVAAVPTANFDNLIAEFHTSGYVKDSGYDVLKLFFRDGNMDDDTVKNQLGNIQ
jgi:hypothetical protein